MRGPVCPSDVKTGKLCIICQAKLKAGQINELDLKVLKAAQKFENRKFLIATELVRAFDLGGMALVFARGNVGALIGKGGKNIKVLENELGKRVRIIEISKDSRDIVQQVVGRVRISAVNKVFMREGELLKVILDERDKKMLAQKEKFEEILGKILGKPIKLSFA